MQIIELDLVDWEPLMMRFVPNEPMRRGRAVELSDLLRRWFTQQQTKPRRDCNMTWWTIDRTEPSGVAASCEHLTRSALRRLTTTVQRNFPEIHRVEIGLRIEGVASGLEFRWEKLPEGDVLLAGRMHHVAPLAVTRDNVTMGQFHLFTSATAYIPDADQANYAGYWQSFIETNWGKSPKLPAMGVTYRDACAFCEWAGVRLPTDAELLHFFRITLESGRRYDWTCDNWTATPAGDDQQIVRAGPYVRHLLTDPPEELTAAYNRNHWDYPFISFRVARPL